MDTRKELEQDQSPPKRSSTSERSNSKIQDKQEANPASQLNNQHGSYSTIRVDGSLKTILMGADTSPPTLRASRVEASEDKSDVRVVIRRIPRQRVESELYSGSALTMHEEIFLRESARTAG